MPPDARERGVQGGKEKTLDLGHAAPQASLRKTGRQRRGGGEAKGGQEGGGGGGSRQPVSERKTETADGGREGGPGEIIRDRQTELYLSVGRI